MMVSPQSPTHPSLWIGSQSRSQPSSALLPSLETPQLHFYRHYRLPQLPRHQFNARSRHNYPPSHRPHLLTYLLPPYIINRYLNHHRFVITTLPPSAHQQLQQHPLPLAPHHVSPLFFPPSRTSPPDPITKRQAAYSLVRYIHPYAHREVLVPCFSTENRFILGRSLGSLHTPTELGLPHIMSERCNDARFVLDLQHGSIVETRYYATTNTFLCIAYTSKSAEYVLLPPSPFMRVQITFRPDDTTEMASTSVPSSSPPRPLTASHHQELLQPLPITPGEHFRATIPATDDLSYSEFIQQPEIGQQPSEGIQSHHQQQTSQPQLQSTHQTQHPTWQYFCTNYSTFLPTGALIAAVRTEPGAISTTLRKECIFVSSNDPYATTFCQAEKSTDSNWSGETHLRLRGCYLDQHNDATSIFSSNTTHAQAPCK